MATPNPGHRDRKLDIERRELLKAIKDQPCTDCDGRFPECAMEFDHVRGAKHDDVSGMKYSRLDKVLDEIRKCDLICSNCHAIRTHERRVQTSGPPKFKSTPWDTPAVVVLHVADALSVGHSLRALARLASTPVGTREIYARIGTLLVDAAHSCISSRDQEPSSEVTP